MPPSRTRFEPVPFAAPLGRRVRMITTCAGVLAAGLVCGGVGLALGSSAPPAPVEILLLAPLLVAGLLVAVAWFSQIVGYRVTSDELLVLRRHREKHFALAGLTSAEVAPEAMAWSLKLFGNDGLGAITGRYYNRRLGRYEALVTDRQHAVVLRWPGRCLVVSPDQPGEFAREVRARAGLRN